MADNACLGVDCKLQFYLAINALPTGIGRVLFQLHSISPGTEAGLKHWDTERIVMFMSFHLNDAEMQYTNPEQECLAVIHCLAEC